MRALILYESLFGNTRLVAEAVAEGIRAARPAADVDCRHVDDRAVPDDVDLVVLGAPTHFWGLTGALSRAMESQYERRWLAVGAAEGAGTVRRAAATSGMRTRLATLPPGGGRAAAAFDTCMTGPLTGGARAPIARRLERSGYRLIAPPETFLVEAVAGPLRAGEADRARAWGRTLAGAIDQHDTTNGRHTMEHQDGQILTTPDGRTSFRGDVGRDGGAPGAAAAGRAPSTDVTRLVTTTELVVGAVLVARYLSRRPASPKALVTMGPGGWVSMKGGTVAVRRGSRPWARPKPVQPASTGQRAPMWARVLSAVPLQALMR